MLGIASPPGTANDEVPPGVTGICKGMSGIISFFLWTGALMAGVVGAVSPPITANLSPSGATNNIDDDIAGVQGWPGRGVLGAVKGFTGTGVTGCAPGSGVKGWEVDATGVKG